MKIYLGKPRYHWYSPYTWLEKIFFWREIDYDEPIIDRLSNMLTPIAKGIQWVLDKVHPEINYIKIDYWDTWSMDHTLSPIILPMLKQLKATKHGSPMVDVEDVPYELQITGHQDITDQLELEFENHEQFKTDSWDITHRRWEWVLDEMIWAFEQLQPDYDWEEQYASGVMDNKWVPVDAKGNEVPKGEHTYWQMKDGPNHTYKIDWVGRKKHEERINNGLRLFGKYYRGLWD